MRRSAAFKPFFIVALAVVWSSVMLSIALLKEMPVGSIQGCITGTDTKRPIANATVWITPKHAKQPDYINRYTRTDEHGKFKFTRVPAGNYTLEASAQVHNIPKSEIVVRDGHVDTLNLQMKPGPSSLDLYTNQNTYTSKETPRIVLHGFTKDKSVKLTLYRIDIGKLFATEAGPIRAFLANQGDVSAVRNLAVNPLVESKEDRSIAINKRDCEGVYQQNIPLEKLTPGVYIMTASADNITRSTWISISDLSLITKESGGTVLAYVVETNTGEPVEAANVDVMEAKKTVASGKTDATGICKIDFPVATGARPARMIFARSEGSIAFLNSTSYEEVSSPITIYAYTDRPVYRPGQRVFFKGIVREFKNDAYQLPAKGNAHVEVQDYRGTLVYAQDLTLTDFGSFSGSLKLTDYATTGQYDVSITCQGKTTPMSFSVAAYKKPEFFVTVEMPKKRCVRGETVKAKIRAQYYFGAPVVGAEIKYSVSQSDYWSWVSDDEYDYGSDYEVGSDYYGGEGESVKEGVARTDSDGTAEIEFKADWKSPQDSYAISDKQFSVYASITDQSRRESNGESSIIATQGDYKINVQSDGYVAQVGDTAHVTLTAINYDKKPQQNRNIEVSAGRVTWKSNEEKFNQVAHSVVKTDSSGKATFSLQFSKPGEYEIRASSRDNNGNIIKSENWIWVSGKGDYGGYKYPDLKIVLDKKVYNPGDTAKILINSSEKGASALLTIEGRRLYNYKTIRLTDKSMLVEVPVESSYKPNFFVSVCYIKDKKLISQEAQARVSLNAQSVKLKVIPNKKRYEPGETATYLVKATDASGKPVKAEVSLGVVDESIYAIMEDDTTPIGSYFYASQRNSVETHYSFPEVYLSGDKAGFTGKVRKKFVDTAFWNADVVTGADGTASVSFKMPDNLTTWRATARACTLDTMVGECRSTSITTKKLLVRLEIPRFLVQNDECLVTALVHNYLPKRQQVTVALRAPGLNVKDQLTKKVTVDSQGVQSVEWRVKAVKPNDVTLTAYAVAPAAQDAVQLTLPVHPRGQRRVEYKAGSINQGMASQKLVVQSNAIPGASEVRIRLAPSMASTMLGSLDYLTGYPYGCTEQTMSMFLPDVVVWETLKSLHISDPDLQQRLPDMVNKGLNRLYDSQNEEGGWGWCQYAEQDLWMTSYVVYGLLIAKSAGFAVDDDVISSGITSIKQQLNKSVKTKDDVHNHIFALYVLSMAGETSTALQMLQPVLKHGTSDARDIARAAMIYSSAGHDDLAKKYIGYLWKKAISAGGYIHWKVTDQWSDSPSESTAIALMAIIKVTPNDPRIPEIVRWLLKNRNYNHWYSTRDTATALSALCLYLKHSNELNPNFTVQIMHNGRSIGKLKFDKSSLFVPEREIVIHSKDIKSGANNINLVMNGQGTLYYTMQLTQYVNLSDKAKSAAGSGLSITREYRKLVSRWDSSAGTNLLQPSRYTLTDFKTGDIIRVRLVVRNKSKRTYQRLLVEDYLPAGCEASDQGRLETWEWTYWYSDRDIRDDRVSFYVDSLPKGKSVLEYEMRASVPGTYCALPPLVESMYQPALSASGVKATVKIND